MRDRIDRLGDAAARLNPRFAWLLLGAGMLVAAVLVLAWSGDRTFAIDEWAYLLQRSHWDPEVLLRPTLGHLTAGGMVLYNLAFSAFGAESHLPLTLITIALQCLVAGLLYAYCSRRLGRWVALIPGLLILFYGAGWEILISSATLPNQVGMVCGLAALLALDRRDRGGDVAACVLLAASVGSFSIGLAFIVGAAVRIQLERRPGDGLRRLLVPAIPLLLYVAWFIWALRYHQTSNIEASNLGSIAAGGFDQLNAALAGITGLFRSPAQPPLDEAILIDTTRTPALVFALLGVLAWRVLRGPRISAAAWGSLSIVAVYMTLIALSLSDLRHADASRYAYMLTVLLMLTGSDLLAGIRIARGWIYGALAVFAFSIVANVAQIRTAGTFFEQESDYNRAELGALELAGRDAFPNYVPENGIHGVIPYGDLTFYSYEYFDAIDRFGSPADAPDEILEEPEPARIEADRVLVQALRLGFEPTVKGGPAPGVRLAPPQVLGASVTERGSCYRLKPDANAPYFARFQVPPPGISFTAEAPPSKVTIGRFADPEQRLVSPPAEGTIALPPDASPQTWTVDFQLASAATFCPAPAD